MRSIGVAASAAAVAISVLGATTYPARAQRAEAVDAGKVAVYEARLRANVAVRRQMCERSIPVTVRFAVRQSGVRQRQLAEMAQACWNVEPTVLAAFTLARILERAGEMEAADAAIAAAETSFAGNALLLSALAGRKARSGDLEEANSLLDQAVALGPPTGERDPDGWTALADTMLDGDNVQPLRLRLYDEAWRRAETRRGRDEKVRILEARATALLEASRHSDALADMDRAMPFALDSNRPRVLLLRARAKKGLGDLDGARADFATAVAAWPPVAVWEQFERRRAAAAAAPAECWIAARASVNLYHDADGDADAIMSAADECIAAGHRAIGLTLKAGVHARLGDKTGALALMEEAIAADGAYAYAHVMRGSILHGAERNAEARASLDRAIELDPDNSHAFIVRAAIRVDLGDREGARADYERGLGLDPTQILVGAHIRNLVALGDHRCALDAIDAAIRFAIASTDVVQMRPMVSREVNKLPHEERQCTAPVRLGSAFEF